MYSRYNPVPEEKFYPVAEEQVSEPTSASLAEEVEEPRKPGLMSGLLDVFKRENGKLDYGSLIVLLVTIMVFLEDGNSETDLLVIAAALLIVGF